MISKFIKGIPTVFHESFTIGNTKQEYAYIKEIGLTINVFSNSENIIIMKNERRKTFSSLNEKEALDEVEKILVETKVAVEVEMARKIAEKNKNIF